MSENALEKVSGNAFRNTQRKALRKYHGMSADVRLVNASDNTFRNASFIHLFIFNLFNLTKINICKHYKWYNKSSVNYMLISINGSYKKIKELLNPPCSMNFKKYKPTTIIARDISQNAPGNTSGLLLETL